MANAEQMAILEQGVAAWNKWREDNPGVEIDLREAPLVSGKLDGANFRQADLSRANLNYASLRDVDFTDACLTGTELGTVDLAGVHLTGADLSGADLSYSDLTHINFPPGARLRGASLFNVKLREVKLTKADLREAKIIDASLVQADLSGADLSGAELRDSDFSGADLSGANLRGAVLTDASFYGASLVKADLSGAKLFNADLFSSNLSEAVLTGADLSYANLVKADVTNAILDHSIVYGVSVWDLKGQFKVQKDLVITPEMASAITVDNIKVAQFIYLILNNSEIRDVINTVTSKAVLILGRFTEERKRVLDAVKEALKQRGYVPILFDFTPSPNRDLTETIQLLANMSMCVIADLTDPKSIPQELSNIIPSLTSLPVQPILLASQREYAMYEHWRKYPAVLEIFRYENEEHLIQNFDAGVMNPVMNWDTKRDELQAKDAEIKRLLKELAEAKAKLGQAS